MGYGTNLHGMGPNLDLTGWDGMGCGTNLHRMGPNLHRMGWDGMGCGIKLFSWDGMGYPDSSHQIAYIRKVMKFDNNFNLFQLLRLKCEINLHEIRSNLNFIK